MNTMIVSLLRRNCIIRYLSNCGHLSFLLHRSLLYYHSGELIQGHILFTSILKPHQEPLLPRDSLYHTSQLLTQPPQKYFPYFLLQIFYLVLDNRPQHDLSLPPLNLRCVLVKDWEESVKIEVFMVSWLHCHWSGYQSISSVWVIFRVFWANIPQNTKTGLHIDLQFSYDWQFRSSVIIKNCILSLQKYPEYVNNNKYASLHMYIWKVEVWAFYW